MAVLAVVALTAVAGVLQAPAGPTSEGSPQDALVAGQDPLRLLRQVQEHHRRIRDLRARFVQRRRARSGAGVVEARGRIYLRIPGRMRWEYEEPEARLFVATGEQMYWYLPSDNQVQVFRPGEVSAAHTPTLYLAGRGDLARDFTATVGRWEAPLRPGNVQLELRPRAGEAAFDRLILEVDPRTLNIARLVVVDPLGSATDHQFHDIETDVDLGDDLFRFEIPPTADVIFVGQG